MIFKGDGWRVVALGLVVGRSVNILLFLLVSWCSL